MRQHSEGLGQCAYVPTVDSKPRIIRKFISRNAKPPARGWNDFAWSDTITKLKTIKPLVGKLPPRLASQAGDERQRSRFRDQTQEWRRWYKTARWQKLRWSVLVRDLFTCKMCGRLEADTSKLVGDHKTPHRGDESMFWDEANIQCVCKACHDSEKQRQERRGW